MAKIVKPLTLSQIKAVRQSDKTQRLYDGMGLILVVRANSLKMRWVFEDRAAGVYRTLGEFPMFSLAEARRWREDLRERIAKGLPLDEKQKTDRRFLFETVYAAWFERWSPDKKNPRYPKQVKQAIDKNVLPSFAGRDVRDIKPFDVAEVLRPLEARGALEYLRRVKGSLTQLFGFAVASGLIDFNPVLAIGNHAFRKAKKGHFRALPPERLRELTDGLECGSVSVVTRLAIYWQLLTMVRPKEAVKAKWADIDLARKCWTIAGEDMKMSRVHVVPLSDLAVALLSEIRAFNVGGVFLFESRDFEGHLCVDALNVALKRAGVDSTAHGLRALAATYFETRGFDERYIHACLAHVKGDVTTTAYMRSTFFDERVDLMNELGQWVAASRDVSRAMCQAA